MRNAETKRDFFGAERRDENSKEKERGEAKK